MIRMFPGYVYKVTKDSSDGRLKAGDLLSVDREGAVSIQRNTYTFLTIDEFNENRKTNDAVIELSGAYRNAVQKNGEHIIAALDDAKI